ncbi:MAG: heme oxygenase (biliverdin-producing) [Leptothrix sp. (in: b-proteobacteria)]
MNATPPTELLARLREATHALHREVERTDLMQCLIAGRLPLRDFCALQRNLHALYTALEAGLQRHAGLIQALCPGWPEPSRLARCARLAADLDHLQGPDWAAALPLVPAARALVARLNALDQSAPRQLLAHAYVRYFGDLAGGQLLARRVQSAYGLPDAAGTSFYAFGPADATAALAQALRSALHGSRIDAGGVDALVAEAQRSFAQHAQMFTELAGAEAAPLTKAPHGMATELQLTRSVGLAGSAG